MTQHPVLILGLGNTILMDDGVGIHAARQAARLLALGEPVKVVEAELGGFQLMDLLEGYRGAVILDAVNFPGRQPGEIVEFDLEHFQPTERLATGHQVSLPTALALGREMGRPMPEFVLVIGVQVAEAWTFGEQCTPAVAQAIEPAATRAVSIAREWLKRWGNASS